MKGLLSTGLVVLTLFALTMSGQSQKANDSKSQKIQSLTVRITKNGFEPKNLSLKRDALARVTFVRQTAETCATEIAIPDFQINKPLPLNKPVTVEFTPTKEGDLTFTCGMNMLRGKVVVQ